MTRCRKLCSKIHCYVEKPVSLLQLKSSRRPELERSSGFNNDALCLIRVRCFFLPLVSLDQFLTVKVATRLVRERNSSKCG